MRLTFWLGAGLLLAPTTAFAHSPVPGIEGFYYGLIHPVSTPAQIVMLLATGLMIGQFQARYYRLFGGLFLLCTLIGLWLGRFALPLDMLLFALSVVAGALTALLPGRLTVLAACLSAGAGLLIGASSLPDPGPVRDMTIAAMGAIVGSNLFLLYLFGMIDITLDKLSKWTQWTPVAMRIAAAWIAAIASLMLALQFAPTTTA